MVSLSKGNYAHYFDHDRSQIRISMVKMLDIKFGESVDMVNFYHSYVHGFALTGALPARQQMACHRCLKFICKESVCRMRKHLVIDDENLKYRLQ